MTTDQATPSKLREGARPAHRAREKSRAHADFGVVRGLLPRSGMKDAILTPAQRESLRVALQDKRQELLRDIDRREEEAAEARAESAEVEDVAEAVIEDRDRNALLEHDRTLLAEIEHALRKMDSGTYGRSETSGKPIAFARLRAIPWARTSTHDAERIERSVRS